MDVTFWLAAIGVAIIIVLIVMAGVSVDTERQRTMAKRIAAQRRMLAEERRARERHGRRASRYQPVGAGWLDDDD